MHVLVLQLALPSFGAAARTSAVVGVVGTKSEGCGPRGLTAWGEGGSLPEDSDEVVDGLWRNRFLAGRSSILELASAVDTVLAAAGAANEVVA